MRSTGLTELKQFMVQLKSIIDNRPVPRVMNTAQKKNFETLKEGQAGLLNGIMNKLIEIENRD